MIVLEAAKVTIYDGDDPDMPMWMVFSGGVLAYVTTVSSVGMLNGIMAIGGSNGAYNIGFIDEVMRFRQDGNDRWQFNVSSRGSVSLIATNLASYVVNNTVNDVAMTVLPNAPIDADTGLPVPTIAVATDGGISIIKDDGSVVDITYTSYTGSNQVKFLPSGGIIYSTDNGNVNQRWIHVDHRLPSADLSKNDVGYKGLLDDEMYHLVNTSTYAGQDMKLRIDNSVGGFIVDNSGDVVLGSTDGSNGGLGFISRSPTNPSEGLTCEITSSHNTGWMHGDIKLATLSDTDTTNAVGTNLVTNGDGSSTTGWSSVRGATLSVSGGNFVVSANTGSYGGSGSQGITTVVGETYTLSFQLISASGGNSYVAVRDNPDVGGGSNFAVVTISGVSAGVYSATFTATGTTTYIVVVAQNPNGVTTVDNISIRLTEEDRSVNGNGLQVFGTVTKTAVATGAELVGYSGFSSSNYLQQPYNADLNFGTGDFSIACWVKAGTANSYRRFISIQNPAHTQNTDDAITIKYAPNSNGTIYAYLGTTEGSIDSS